MRQRRRAINAVSSANIACGFHAGDAQIMQACVREAIKNGVAMALTRVFPTGKICRSAMQLPPETVYAQTLYSNWRAGRMPMRKAA
ncbi:LamB/YcsF family protein [Escherichia coli]